MRTYEILFKVDGIKYWQCIKAKTARKAGRRLREANSDRLLEILTVFPVETS